MNNHKCLETVAEKWEQPFSKPLTFNRETGDLSASQWAVKVYNLTKGGNISKTESAQLFINFCPLCGEKLTGAAG